MAEHPIIMEQKQLNLKINRPGQQTVTRTPTESVVTTAPKVSDGKETFGQRLSEYAFGEKVAEPGKYIWKSYLEPTGKRVANDIVEHFLLLLKHTFQRWIWNGKTLDDGKWMDRTSFSKISSGQEPIKARVMMSPVKELTFATRLDAEKVLNHLKGVIQNDKAVTVREYYESGGCPELCGDGTASSSGWDNLNKVEIKEQPDGSGFTLNLPRPMDLSKK